MKTIFCIVLFLASTVSRAQLSAGALGVGGTSSNGSSGTYTSRTYFAGHLYVMAVQHRETGGATHVPILTGTGMDWTNIGSVTLSTVASPIFMQTAFLFAPTADVTGALTIDWGGVTVNGYTIYGFDVFNFGGTPTIGNLAQVVTAAADGTTTPNVTMSDLSDAYNAVLVFATNNKNPFAGTAEAGFTESQDGGFSIFMGRYGMYSLNGTDNTPSITTAESCNWGIIAIEIDNSRRRRHTLTYEPTKSNFLNPQNLNTK